MPMESVTTGPETTAEIRTALERALGAAGAPGDFALLDYPAYFNIGDHLIWLGALEWACSLPGARLRYVSSAGSFSQERLRRCGARTLVFTGGGNVGDLWPYHQKFRERVIAANPGLRVVILPQSVYFRSDGGLREACRVFNAHPDLTLFVRDRGSFDAARSSFTRCNVVLSPDMAFMLSGMPCFEPDAGEAGRVLFHARNDRELSGGELPLPDALRSADRSDWCTMTPLSRLVQRIVARLPWAWPGSSRNGAAGAAGPGRRGAAWEWAESLEPLAGAPLHLRSLRFALRGARQFAPYGTIVTNRLHGHILAVLMGKPNVLLANAYHKNEAFYRTWTCRIPWAKFASRGSDLQTEFEALARSA